jgi:hypothetical protein
MTTTTQRARGKRATSLIPASPGDDRSELAGLIGAGVMTFLLSGDLRLATRATRLLIAERPVDVRTDRSRNTPPEAPQLAAER